MGTDRRIGFLAHGRENSPGTRVRVLYVAKYIENSVVSRNPDDLADCDAVVFQKRYKTQDVIFAKWLKSQGKKVLVDLCDPVWDSDYPAVYFPITGDKKEDFEELLKLSDMVMLCTSRLKEMFDSKYPSVKNRVLIDRFDLSIHEFNKLHVQKDKYTILWHGSKFNVPSIELARDDLEKLYREINFKLTIIHEAGAEKLKSFSFDTEYKKWDLQTINDDIRKADITINTHYLGSYKSNGKTIKSWALGVPCVEKNYYRECKRYLESAELRNREAREKRELIEEEYDSRISAKEIEELCNT